MPDVKLELSDKQFQALCKAAALKGLPVEKMAEEAVSAAIDARYRLPTRPASVVPFQSLKSSGKD